MKYKSSCSTFRKTIIENYCKGKFNNLKILKDEEYKILFSLIN